MQEDKKEEVKEEGEDDDSEGGMDDEEDTFQVKLSDSGDRAYTVPTTKMCKVSNFFRECLENTDKDNEVINCSDTNLTHDVFGRI